jgi:hypothetical protein
MDPAIVPAAAPVAVTFADGLGQRHQITDRSRNEPVELLCLRGELTSVPSFEFALRERVSHLATFHHGCYAHVRGVERLKNSSSTLVVVSDVTAGVRLSDVLAFADRTQVTLDIDAALCLLRQIVPAVAMLHENAPGVSHGAIAVERIIVTPGARIVMVEHVLGSAIGELHLSRERYWKELRVALPGTTSPPVFNHRSDVTQIGVVALSLILGRPLADDELASRLGDVVASSWAISARGGLEPLPAGLRAWLMRALQLDPRESFESAIDAQAELERVLGESDYLAAPSTLNEFIAQYHAQADDAAAAAQTPTPSAQAFSPPLASESIDLRRSSPQREERDGPTPSTPAPLFTTPPVPAPSFTAPSFTAPSFTAPSYTTPSLATPPATVVRPVDRTVEPRHHIVTPAAPVPAPAPASGVHAARPMGRPADVVRHAETAMPPAPAARPAMPSPAPLPVPAPVPVAQTPPVSPASSSRASSSPASSLSEPRYGSPYGSPKREERDGGKHVAHNSRVADHTRDSWRHDAAPAPLETGTKSSKAPKIGARRKRWWPAAAAAATLVALAGAGVPAARRYMAPGAVVKEGTLAMTTNPEGAHLFVDGVERGVTPLTVALKPGAHSLEIRVDGAAPRLMPITITAGSQLAQYIELPKTASQVGQLQVQTQPAGARVSVDGIWRGVAPVTVAELAPGEHAIVLEGDQGSVKQTVTVEAGITASLVVPLGAPEGAPVSGWISFAVPADVQVFENKRLLGSSQSDRVMVSAGRHELEIINEALGYRSTRTVQVLPGKVTPIKIEFPKGTIAINAIPWAEVWVDGERAGDTPIGSLSLTIGSHDVVFRHPDLGEQRQKAIVTLATPARLSVDMRKK